jgi:hypothetical protein
MAEEALIKKHVQLWNVVSKTNPKYTKKVKFGRAFTAIDPHSQIYAATKMFGPVGTGWGWEIVRIEYTITNEVAILIKLWHGERSNTLEQWGQAGLYIDKKETMKDGDCFKKATTDGLTKCLSYLGFNADVFLGKFDDSKYVQSMDNEFREENAKEDAPQLTNDQIGMVNTLISSFEACKKIEEVKQLLKDNNDFMKMLKTDGYTEYASVANAYKKADARGKANQIQEGDS